MSMDMKRTEVRRDLGLRIGVAVRRYREHGGLTQEALAEKVGVDQSEISLIERGKRSKLSTLDRVSEALDRRLSDLIRFAEDVGDSETVKKEARAFVKRVRARKKVNSPRAASKRRVHV